ncbi:MAG: phosphotransferase enzyme family protein [Acutalibacteraceae bacterium]
MIDNEQIQKVCRAFGIDGKLVKTQIFTDGHINSTYCAQFENNGETKKYLVQNVNIHVFKDQDLLMNNIVGVTDFLAKRIAEEGGDPKRETLHFLKAESGKYYYPDGDNCWRIYDFIDNSYTYNLIDSNEIFESAGQSFGRFQCLLDGYPCEKLGETIPNFHNTPKRVEALEKAIENNAANRADSVKAEIEFALSKKDKAGLAVDLLSQGKIPVRVTHNDTKINNILFDEETHKGLCVIDLDTIMPGLSLYDFGDAIRSGASTALEDETDLSKVSVSLPLYESYVKGYLTSCASALTEAEVDHLAYGAWLMTYECGVRFLTDYLDGDVYFRTDRPNHNLDRARNQFKMASDIELHMDEMNEATRRIYNELMSK